MNRKITRFAAAAIAPLALAAAAQADTASAPAPVIPPGMDFSKMFKGNNIHAPVGTPVKAYVAEKGVVRGK